MLNFFQKKKPQSFMWQMSSVTYGPEAKTVRADLSQATQYAFENLLGEVAPRNEVAATFPIGGATRTCIKTGDIRKLRVHLPPFKGQQRSVAVLEGGFEGLAQAHADLSAGAQDLERQCIRIIQDLFDHLQFLLQKAFAGEVS